MYEKPELNPVGTARDVILGLSNAGNDLDGTWVGGDFEFAPEFDVRTE